jgi:predicted DNA-binding transcriptional regulator AlpA
MTTTIQPLGTDAVAAMIGISPMTLRIWRVHGKGPKFVKLGDAKQAGVVYFEADVLAWLAQRKFNSTSAYSPHGRTSSKVQNLASSGASA